MNKIYEVLAVINAVTYPLAPILFVLFLLLAISDITEQKEVGIWIQKAIVAAVGLMTMLATYTG